MLKLNFFARIFQRSYHDHTISLILYRTAIFTQEYLFLQNTFFNSCFCSFIKFQQLIHTFQINWRIERASSCGSNFYCRDKILKRENCYFRILQLQKLMSSKMFRGSEFSSYEIELQNRVRKMTLHFELLTRKCLQKLFFQVTNSTL